MHVNCFACSCSLSFVEENTSLLPTLVKGCVVFIFFFPAFDIVCLAFIPGTRQRAADLSRGDHVQRVPEKLHPTAQGAGGRAGAELRTDFAADLRATGYLHAMA